MREIKFRAWDKRSKKVREVNTITFHDKRASFDYDDPRLPKLFWLWGYDVIEQKDITLARESKEVILLQYTGLKDKNGTEICEGDIYHMGDPEITYTVVWHDTGLIGKQNGSSSYAGLLSWQERIEVIGNIYENPELLEGEE